MKMPEFDSDNIREFILSSVQMLGGKANRNRDDTWLIEVPQSLQQKFGFNASLRIAFDEDISTKHKVELVSALSPLTTNLASAMKEIGLVTTYELKKDQKFNLPDLIINGLENISRKEHIDYLYLVQFFFKVTCSADEVEEEVFNILVDGNKHVISKSVIKDLHFVQANYSKEFKNIEELYAEAKKGIESESEHFIENFNQRLLEHHKDEIDRLHQFYSALKKEEDDDKVKIEEEIVATKRKLEKTHTKEDQLKLRHKIHRLNEKLSELKSKSYEERLELEKQQKLSELTLKHKANVDYRLIGAIIYRAPQKVLVVEGITFKGHKKQIVASQSILEEAILPKCEVCSEAKIELFIDKNEHIFDKSCLVTCSICGDKSCKSCSDKQCYICKKDLCNSCVLECNSCKNYMCKYDSKQCSVCKKINCDKCNKSCSHCKLGLCLGHLLKCNICKKELCPECIKDMAKDCSDCKKVSCTSHFFKCKICDKSSCSECMSKCCDCKKYICNDHLSKCNICKNKLCVSCLKTCKGCKKKVCGEEFSICKNCSEKVCSNCHVEQKKLFLFKKNMCVLCTK